MLIFSSKASKPILSSTKKFHKRFGLKKYAIHYKHHARSPRVNLTYVIKLNSQTEFMPLLHRQCAGKLTQRGELYQL